jgi:HAD superfamily hydrolase (TIGR01549 family)
MTPAQLSGPEGPIRAAVAPSRLAPVRVVLFDFSCTLFQIRTYAERIRAAVPAPVDDSQMDRILSGLETGLSDPDVIRAQQRRDISSEAHRRAFTTWYASAPVLAPFAEALYEQLRSPEYWLPYADTAATLAELTRSGIALGVVSDVGWDLRATFAHHHLDHFFSAWVHSYEHHTEKPDPLLFRNACSRLDVDPAETLMVGDHPAKDGGAAGAGLRSYVLPSAAVPGGLRGLDAVLHLVTPGRESDMTRA